jgi:hypothetical protein
MPQPESPTTHHPPIVHHQYAVTSVDQQTVKQSEEESKTVSKKESEKQGKEQSKKPAGSGKGVCIC